MKVYFYPFQSRCRDCLCSWACFILRTDVLEEGVKGKNDSIRIKKIQIETGREYWKKYYKQKSDLPCSSRFVKGLPFMSFCLYPCKLSLCLYSKFRNWNFLNFKYLNVRYTYACVSVYLCICLLMCGEGNSNPLQYSWLENSMDRRAWRATIHPWGRKELDMTEWLSVHFLTCVSIFSSVCVWIAFAWENTCLCTWQCVFICT